MKDTCISCVFYSEGCGAVGTCGVSDTAVHEAQDACGNYTFWEDKNFKAIKFKSK